MTMISSRTAFLFSIGSVLPVSVAGAAGFCYEPASADCFGPERWKDIIYTDGTENQCDTTTNDSNSPIAVGMDSAMRCDFSSLGYYSFDNGGCTLDDIDFTISDIDVKASFPSTCSRPKVTIPFEDEGLQVFEALQFHLHLKSEHTIDNVMYDAELHIVHERTPENGRFAVIGMVIAGQVNGFNAKFEELLVEWETVASETCGRNRASHLRAPTGWQEQATGDFNAYDLVPQNTTFFNYNGSLTIPPCSEVIEWNLASTPLIISSPQLARLERLILNYRDPVDNCKKATVAYQRGTNRPLVPLGGREVRLICPGSS